MGIRISRRSHLFIFYLSTYFYFWNESLSTTAAPQSQNSTARERRDPGLEIGRNPDGSISGSLSLAKAIDLPFLQSSFDLTKNVRIGLDGISFSESDASSLNTPIGGFSDSNAQSSNLGLGGLSSAFANAASIENPLFHSSFSNSRSKSKSFDFLHF